jgi:hypothetical protein
MDRKWLWPRNMVDENVCPGKARMVTPCFAAEGCRERRLPTNQDVQGTISKPSMIISYAPLKLKYNTTILADSILTTKFIKSSPDLLHISTQDSLKTQTTMQHPYTSSYSHHRESSGLSVPLSCAWPLLLNRLMSFPPHVKNFSPVLPTTRTPQQRRPRTRTA